MTSFSSRGPNPWYSWQKPDVAAFGSNVLSASNFGGTRVMSGTSMATPESRRHHRMFAQNMNLKIQTRRRMLKHSH